MQLTQSEIIQILRRRKELNQAELGVTAFGLRPDSARTKIKNIELGRQQPTAEETAKLALALDVESSALAPAATQPDNTSHTSQGTCGMSPDALKIFPGLTEYIEMLNNAVRIGDQDLVGYIAGKLSALFAMNYKGKAASNR